MSDADDAETLRELRAEYLADVGWRHPDIGHCARRMAAGLAENNGKPGPYYACSAFLTPYRATGRLALVN